MPLGESDTRAKLIDPVLHGRGWTEDLIRLPHSPHRFRPPAIPELGTTEGLASPSSPLWLPVQGESGHSEERLLVG
jgi:hypothetical protein